MLHVNASFHFFQNDNTADIKHEIKSERFFCSVLICSPSDLWTIQLLLPYQS